MALVLKDRVKEQSTTTGTGTLTLSGPFDGYQAFSVIGNGNVTYYTIYDPASGDWEVGYGTYTLSGTTLSRDFVYASSNSGSLVDFVAGTKEVFCTYPAEQAVYEQTDGETVLRDGPITVVGAGVTSIPTLPAELGKFVADVDLFAQIYNINQNDGASASADFVAYNDLTTDGYTNFIDVGINSSNYSSVDYPIFTPGSGYLFHDGQELFVGTATANKDVVIFAGGVDTANIAATVSGTDQSITTEAAVNVGGALDVTGAAAFGGVVSLSQDPTLALQAATKQYVDNAVSNGFHVHEPVLVATPSALTATYNNGSSGVGATLTNSGAQAAISIDGVSLSVNDRVLVWQQSSQAQNGVYVVTTVGSGSTNWVLTRASDADTYAPQSDTGLGGGDYFFVSSGATLGFSSYVCTNDGVIIFGTTAITFQQFSTVPSYVVTAPLSLTGNTLSLSGTVAATNGGTGTSTVTTGDLLYGSSTDTWSKLALGGAYRSLVVNASGTQVEWNAVPLNQANAISGSLGATNGGTGQSSYATGDTLYASATNTLAKLTGNTTTTRKFLSQTGTGSASQAPTWDTVAASDITSGTLAVARGGTGLGSYAVGDIVYASGTGTLAGLADVVTGNVLLSGGTNTAPAYGKVGLATHVSGTLGLTNGGTGQTTAQAAINSLAGAVTSGQYLRGNGTNVLMSAIQAADVPTLNQNTTGSAGSVVNALTMNNGGAGDASGTTFNGSAARTISYNTIGASPLAGSSSLTTTGTVTSGTWSASFGAVSGANLTNLTAGNLSGTIPSAVLGNSTHYVGTTAVALNRASANQALTGITSIAMPGASSGTITITPAAAAGTTALTIPANSGSFVTTGDTGTVTNTMLAGSIANAKLANSSVTINGTSVSLGGSITVTATATNALTISSPLSGTSYNGSSAVSIGLASGYGDTQNPYASKTANFFLAAPNGTAGAPTFRAIVAADIPTLNQNTTGTAGNVSGTVAIANGGTGSTTAAGARTNLGATTVGSNFFTLANPSAITFPRVNVDNTVSMLDAATFRTAIGAGTSSTTGTVTSVSGTGTVSGLSLSGTVTSSGNITLGGTLAVTPSNFASQTANTFLASPNGAAGVPTFRALVAADVPTLNQDTTGSAATLTTTRTLWGRNFNGSANVTGALSSVTTLSMSGQLTNTVATGTAPLVISSTTRVANLNVATAGTADTATALTTASGSAPSYSARAWVNFNGVGTVSIRGSGNVSSITDNGVGVYRVNYTTAMSDANYAVSTGPVAIGSGVGSLELGAYTTTYVGFQTRYQDYNAYDWGTVFICVFR